MGSATPLVPIKLGELVRSLLFQAAFANTVSACKGRAFGKLPMPPEPYSPGIVVDKPRMKMEPWPGPLLAAETLGRYFT